MKFNFLLLFCVFLASCEKSHEDETVWKMDSISEIGGNSLEIHGNPTILRKGDEQAILFNGQNDGLLIDANPIHNLEEFNIELDLKPSSGYPENREQRFLHIQDPENENRRILIELRLNEKEEWYGDWFIKSENESLTLIDSAYTHPVGEWATIGMVYSNGVIKGYVNGKEEVSGKFQYLPIGKNAKTSIGTRMDKRSWFKGAIKEVRFFPVNAN